MPTQLLDTLLSWKIQRWQKQGTWELGVISQNQNLFGWLVHPVAQNSVKAGPTNIILHVHPPLIASMQSKVTQSKIKCCQSLSFESSILYTGVQIGSLHSEGLRTYYVCCHIDIRASGVLRVKRLIIILPRFTFLSLSCWTYLVVCNNDEGENSVPSSIVN